MSDDDALAKWKSLEGMKAIDVALRVCYAASGTAKLHPRIDAKASIEEKADVLCSHLRITRKELGCTWQRKVVQRVQLHIFWCFLV